MDRPLFTTRVIASPPAEFAIIWNATNPNSRFQGTVRFRSREDEYTVMAAAQAVQDLAICLGRVLARGFACAPQCSGEFICLEADHVEMELLQTSLVVEIAFAGTDSPNLQTDQYAFFTAVCTFLDDVLQWLHTQPCQEERELTDLIAHIRTHTSQNLITSGDHA
ncbi:MAG TPA: hypothetical protein PK691_06200 [Thermomicrobiales bacterium]|nr:hypothetical protein [Thermomicrobiales bacterium]